MPLLSFNLKELLLLSLLIAVSFVACNKSCKLSIAEKQLAKCKEAKPTHDTITVVIPEQTPISETLTKVKETKPSKREIDSFISFVVDTSDLTKWKDAFYELAEMYNLEKEYEDTAIFKNGIAITKTRVKQNEIQEQKTILDSIRQEIIYNTIYKTEKAKDRTQFYLGIEAFGNKNELLQATGFSGLLKLKSNIGFEGGYYFNSQQQNFYKVGVKFLIRLKKP